MRYYETQLEAPDQLRNQRVERTRTIMIVALHDRELDKLIHQTQVENKHISLMSSRSGRRPKVLQNVMNTVSFPGRTSTSTLSGNSKVKVVHVSKHYVKSNLQTTQGVASLKGSKILSKRQFCSSNEKTELFIVEPKLVNDNLSSEGVVRSENEKTLTPKTDEELIDSKSPSTIDKLQSLKAANDGCYSKITKYFLADPYFLRFAYHNIKSKEGNLTHADPKDETLDGISLE